MGRTPWPAVGAKREGGRSRLLPIAVVLAAVGILVLVGTLPPKPLVVSGANPTLVSRTARGAIHVHTTRSDGFGDKAAVARAARRAGLNFVVLTDHGDGMRPTDPPAYLDGVLCLDAVEVSTDDGHYVALGSAPSPYPLGGASAAVVEDVRRLGGFGIAAHPTSNRPDLRWSDWSAPIDAIEWLNTDSEWRNESRVRLASLLMPYLFRPAGALGRILDRPEAALSAWDDVARRRRVLGMAGNDAHGGIGNRVEDRSHRWSLRVPSYEASFRLFSTNVQLDDPLTGDAVRDAAALVTMLKAGRSYTEIDAVASGSTLEFTGQTAAESVEQGSLLGGPGPATFRARAQLPPGGRFVAYTNGRIVAESPTGALEFTSGEQGAHRVEVHVGRSSGTPRVPWLVSNPIFRLPPPAEPPPLTLTVIRKLEQPPWRMETDPRSGSTLQKDEKGNAEFSYELYPDARVSQFVALVADFSDLPQFDALRFSIRSAAPRRVSVQFRFSRDHEARWGTSVYVDSNRQVVTVPVEGLRRADGPASRPPIQRATSLLFVIDLTNAVPGDNGRIEVGEVEVLRQSLVASR